MLAVGNHKMLKPLSVLRETAPVKTALALGVRTF